MTSRFEPQQAGHTFNPSGLNIFMAVPVRDFAPHQTLSGFMDSLLAAASHGIRMYWGTSNGSNPIPQTRNALVEEFMKTDCTHMFMFDSDMDWTSREFLRFVCLGTKMDVLVGPYPMRFDPITFLISGKESQPNEYGCVKITATGLGFCIVSRRVIQTLYAKAPRVRFNDKFARGVFRFELRPIETPEGPALDFVGEDILFFEDVQKAGFDVWMDPHVVIGHVGLKSYKGGIKKAEDSNG